jgi:hypothetical protein
MFADNGLRELTPDVAPTLRLALSPAESRPPLEDKRCRKSGACAQLHVKQRTTGESCASWHRLCLSIDEHAPGYGGKSVALSGVLAHLSGVD